MKRLGILLFGLASYAFFFATFLYLIGFLANAVVPRTIDAEGGYTTAATVTINVFLLALFGVQHTVMARQGFKDWLTNFIPQPAERSVYVFLSSLCLAILFVFWRPMPESLWQLEGIGRALLYGAYALGLGLVLYSTFLIDHFDLFGLRQVILEARKTEYGERSFRTPALYKFIRHPIYLGWIMTIWATPSMTLGRALLASGWTFYIFIAIAFEERDLVARFGARYENYARRTPMIIPRLSGRRPERGTASVNAAR